MNTSICCECGIKRFCCNEMNNEKKIVKKCVPCEIFFLTLGAAGLAGGIYACIAGSYVLASIAGGGGGLTSTAMIYLIAKRKFKIKPIRKEIESQKEKIEAIKSTNLEIIIIEKKLEEKLQNLKGSKKVTDLTGSLSLLPKDIINTILNMLNEKELLNVSGLSKGYYSLIEDSFVLKKSISNPEIEYSQKTEMSARDFYIYNKLQEKKKKIQEEERLTQIKLNEIYREQVLIIAEL